MHAVTFLHVVMSVVFGAAVSLQENEQCDELDHRLVLGAKEMTSKKTAPGDVFFSSFLCFFFSPLKKKKNTPKTLSQSFSFGFFFYFIFIYCRNLYSTFHSAGLKSSQPRISTSRTKQAVKFLRRGCQEQRHSRARSCRAQLKLVASLRDQSLAAWITAPGSIFGRGRR